MSHPFVIITALENELDPKRLPPGVKVVYSGIGKINAAIATLKAIQSYSPREIINFGTVGRINPAVNGLLDIGKVVQRDVFAEPLAPRGQVPFSTRPNAYLSDGGIHVCGSGDSFVTESDPWLIAQEIDVVDMELFAISAVAHDAGIPWRSFKYITDDADASAGADWHKGVQHGEELFLEQLRRVMGSTT
jgi:adenosylhomocysteine nucleosidase